jgi:hypothetical protein
MPGGGSSLSVIKSPCVFHAKPKRDRVRHATPASDDAPVFVPLRIIDVATQVAFEVVLERGRVVRILRGFDAATLRQLLAVLEEERPC